MLTKTCPICKKNTLFYDEEVVSCSSCKIYRKKLNIIKKALVWAYDKSFIWRLPIIIYFALLLQSNLQKSDWALNRMANFFSALDFGIHEIGHRLFIPFGEFMTIAGGSIFQLLFPLLWMLGFLQKKWYFAASMCWCWLGLNLFDVATYAADARARELPLNIGFAIFGIDPTNTDAAYDQSHDWYQILTRLNKLDSDLVIAQGFRNAGIIAFIVGFTIGGVLLITMLYGTVRRLNGKKTI
jgi:hypothetical protein